MAATRVHRRAGAPFAREKPVYRHRIARFEAGRRTCDAADRHRAHLECRLPVYPGFHLHRLVRKLQADQRQPGRRVAQRVDCGNFPRERDRVARDGYSLSAGRGRGGRCRGGCGGRRTLFAHRARFFLAHHRRGRGFSFALADRQVAQHRVVEFKRVLQLL